MKFQHLCSTLCNIQVNAATDSAHIKQKKNFIQEQLLPKFHERPKINSIARKSPNNKSPEDIVRIKVSGVKISFTTTNFYNIALYRDMI